MSNSINPTEIEIGGVEPYENDEAVLNSMSALKKIDSSDSFQHQFVDLGGEGKPIVQFSSEIENADDQELVNIQRRSNDGRNLLQVYLSFPYESMTTFNATLNEILNVIGSLTVEYLGITYRIDHEFISLDSISEISDILDYELQGIRVTHKEFTYEIQRRDSQTAIAATLDEVPNIGPDSNEDFIKTEVATASSFVKRVCNE